MKLSEYIQKLQVVLGESGDLECYYSCDDEGNGFYKVNFDPGVSYTTSLDWRLDCIFSDQDEYDEDCEYNELEDEDKEELIPICIVN